MAYLAVDKDGTEVVFNNKPQRIEVSDRRGEVLEHWDDGNDTVLLPKGSIFKLIGRELTWEDEPVEI